ncbi:MAG TPA: type 1 glutamine amidotransferase [Solirubrobacteraceae bacterium]
MSATPARLLVLQHARCEPPGVYEHELRERGVALHRVVLDEGEMLPDWRGYDGLVVMGGAMGAYERDAYAWIDAELELIAQAVAQGTPYWGVCLGAQLLAAALGARVAPGPAPELGVREVELTAPARADPVFGAAPDRFLSLQWHGDTYELPRGAVQLARSPMYEQQAFGHGRAYGVQFHLEVDRALAERWAAVPSYVEQLERHEGPGAAQRMVEQVAAAERESVPLARSLFGRWLEAVVGV